MKVIKYYKYLAATSILLLSSMFFISCEKNLDVAPSKELEGSYFDSENKIQRAVGSVYAKMADMYSPQANQGGCPITFSILAGDDITFDGTGSAYETWSGLNASDYRIFRMWQRLYQWPPGLVSLWKR